MQQFELNREFLDDLREALFRNREEQVLSLVRELHIADIAEILSELELEEALLLYKYLDADKAANVIAELDRDVRERFFAALSPGQIGRLFINNMDSDDAADVLSELSETMREEVIASMDDLKRASSIVDLLSYDENSAGGLMAKELIKVNQNWDMLKCVKEMRKQAREIENVYTIYAVDDYNKLLGTLSLKRLLLASSEKKVKDIYHKDVIYVKAAESSEEVANIMKKYDLVVLPVIDELGRLIGRITIDDVVDVIKDEADKDYQMASGFSEKVESSDKVLVSTRARLPWLIVGLIGGIMGARVIGAYETQLQIYPEMAFFIPLIAAMAGNVGVQSSAIIVQGLANNSLKMQGLATRVGKELLIGLINGLVCSLLILAYNLIFSDSLNLSYTVSIALLSVILFAAVFGTVIPLLLNRFKVDPALATGPFITTMNDIVGLFLYFFIGHLMYL